MIGAIIGDIAGSRFEFDNTNDYGFKLFDRDKCKFTDDTICTIAIADAALNHKDYGDSLKEWCQKFPNPIGGYGCMFSQWVMSESTTPYYSYGNGSAMRVSSIGWLFDDIEDVLREAKKSAEVTHNHPEGIKGAQAVAHAIYYLRKNKSLPGLVIEMQKYYPDFEKKEYPKNVFQESCQEAVPLCLQIIVNSKSFEDAIRTAISWGGDSDTLGAIVGSMAEAKYGAPALLVKGALRFLPLQLLEGVKKYYDILRNNENGKGTEI